MKKAAAALRKEAENSQSWLEGAHSEALFFGASGPPALLPADHLTLIGAVQTLDEIAGCILSAPPISQTAIAAPSVEGFPVERIGNAGSWSKEAFAIRMAQIFRQFTGRRPAVWKAEDGPYQRMMSVASAQFRSVYREAGEPFGKWAPPSRRHLEAACSRLKGRKPARP